MTPPRAQFVICVSNETCEDLSLGMVYHVICDEEALREGLLRVFDVSGEDFLYPASHFVRIIVPAKEEQRLLSVTDAKCRYVRRKP